MDHGTLTDHNGKKIDFRNVVLIMTTNAGAADLAKPAIGFGNDKREGDDEEAIKRLFTPEFRNRLDSVVSFGNLPPEVIARVVEKFVLQLEAQLADRNITFELTEEANRWIASRGYDEHFGARPLGRVIQEHIKKPIADEVLFGKLKRGGTVRVLVGEDGQLAFEYIETPPSAPRTKKKKTPKKKKGPGPKDQGPDDQSGPDDSSDDSGGGSVPSVPVTVD